MKMIAFIFGALLFGAPLVSAAEPPPLTHNPFSRPPSERTLSAVRLPGVDQDMRGIVLVATMVAGKNRLANVDGRILRPGDEINGYVLRKVFEDRAVFDSNGRLLTVHVKPEREDDDE